MAYDFAGKTVSYISSGNLSAKQFYPVKAGTAVGSVALQTSTGGVTIGILQNTPSTAGGDGASVMVDGITKAVKISTATAAITRGAAIVVGTTLGGLGPTTGKGFVIGRAESSMSSGTTGLFVLRITMEGIGSTGW